MELIKSFLVDCQESLLVKMFFLSEVSFARFTRTSERQLSKKSFISNGEQVGIDSCHHLGPGTKLLSEFRQNTVKTRIFLNTSHVFVVNDSDASKHSFFL